MTRFLGVRARPAVVLVAVLAGLTAVGWLAGWGLRSKPSPADLTVVEWFARNRQPWVTTLARMVTELGGTAVLVPLAVAAGLLARRHDRSAATTDGLIRGIGPDPSAAATERPAGPRSHDPSVARSPAGAALRAPAFLAVVFLGTELMMRVAKHAAARARPPQHLAVGHFPDPAFPSAHTMLAVAVVGAAAVVLVSRVPRDAATARSPASPTVVTVAVWALAGTAMAGVALTRLYLGAHWPTDVAAGAVLAGAWLAACTAVMRPGPRSLAP